MLKLSSNVNECEPLIVGSYASPGQKVKVVPGPAEVANSDFFVNDTQGVGYAFVGVYPRDQFDNLCDVDRQGLTLVHFSPQPEPCLSLDVHVQPSVSTKGAYDEPESGRV